MIHSFRYVQNVKTNLNLFYGKGFCFLNYYLPILADQKEIHKIEQTVVLPMQKTIINSF